MKQSAICALAREKPNITNAENFSVAGSPPGRAALSFTAARHIFEPNQQMSYPGSGEPAPQSIGPLAKIPVPGAYTQTDGAITAKIGPEAETLLRVRGPLNDTANSRAVRLFFGW